MSEYAKIKTVFERDLVTHKVLQGGQGDWPGLYKSAEFAAVHDWHLTEKIDGTNIRVVLEPEYGGFQLRFLGRTDRAQLPADLYEALYRMFNAEQMVELFHADDPTDTNAEPYGVTLYGEGYGPRIQKGGGSYRSDPGFRLFDVKVGRKWLDWPNVVDIAGRLGIHTVPDLGVYSVRQAVDLVRIGFTSIAAMEDGGAGLPAEGVVAKTIPYLYDWRGNRVMWKLKSKDFA